MVRRYGGRIDDANTIGQNLNALGAKTAQDGAARTLSVKCRRDSRLTVKCVTQSARELRYNIVAVKRGCIPDQLTGGPLRSRRCHENRLFNPNLISRSLRVCKTEQKRRD